MSSFSPPPGYARIKVVCSFQELVATPFTDGINAHCWARTVGGDFGEIVTRLGTTAGINALDESRLAGLALSPAGDLARETLLADLKLLREHGLAPELNCLHDYPRDDDAIMPTDVYSFHADRAPIPADTYLCTYHGAPSEGLRQEDARRRIDDPAMRSRLLALYGGPDDEGYCEFLREHCYDLHFSALPAAQPFSFGLGHLWRIAIAYPGNPVPPCVHRAPLNLPGQPPRLLLIS